jgi:hypothetical protein
MVFENPLITLGIPRAVLVHELAGNNLADILKLADANYKTFVKQYHPDRPSGDEDLMTAFGKAIQVIQDPKILEFYVKELVGQKDVDALRLQGQSQKLLNRDTQALSHLASGMQHLDQFRALGISTPTTFIAALGGQRVVINVTSPTSAFARITNLENGSENLDGFYSLEVEYRERVWREAHLDERQDKHWTAYTDFGAFIGNIKLIGFVPHRPKDERPAGPELEFDSSKVMLDAPTRQLTLDWINPEDCWFLPKLVFANSIPKQIDGLVLYKEGRFAITGDLLGMAPL